MTQEIWDLRNLGPTKNETQKKWDPRKMGPTKIETHKIAGDPHDLANNSKLLLGLLVYSLVEVYLQYFVCIRPASAVSIALLLHSQKLKFVLHF